MTRGGVYDDEAVVRVGLLGRRGGRTVTAVVDTGMTGGISLPRDFFDRYRAGPPRTRVTVLGDGREVAHAAAQFRVRLGGRTVRVWGDCLGGEILIGMTLLRGHRLTAECRDGGPVTIAPLPQ